MPRAKSGRAKMKKGMTVKMMSSAEMKKHALHPDYMKYNLKIAGKTVVIKRAIKSLYGDSIEVEGYPLYRGDSGFDEILIKSLVSENRIQGEIKMSNENIVQQIIDKTNESKKGDSPRIYRLKWASGHSNVVSLNEAIETINRWANKKDWDWIRIINTETNKQQVVYESATRIGRKLNKLNEDLLENKGSREQIKKVLAKKGYGEILASIDKSISDLKRAGYSKGEIKDTIIDTFDIGDTRIKQHIEKARY